MRTMRTKLEKTGVSFSAHATAWTNTCVLLSALTLFTFTSCKNCTYATREFINPSCLPAGGPSVTTISQKRATAVAPVTDASNFSVKLSVNCIPSQADYCRVYSDSAPFFSVLLRSDPLNPNTFTAASGKNYTSCAAFWTDFSNDPTPFTPNDILGVFIGDNGANSVSCNDASGCQNNQTSSFLTNFNPSVPLRTDNISISVKAGSYLACAFIDSWNLPGIQAAGYTAFPYPLTQTSVPINSSNYFTLSCQIGSPQDCVTLNAPCFLAGTCNSGGGGAPVNAPTAGQGFILQTIGANTTINFSQWMNAQ